MPLPRHRGLADETLTIIDKGIMKTWICKKCGYSHQGEEAPERCPQCGAQKSEFYQYKKNDGCAYNIVLLIILLLVTAVACNSRVTVDNSPVPSVDINRYLGNWYEVARYDHRFERGLTHCTANYTMQEDGTVQIVNRGMKKGERKTSVGKAKLTSNPGILRVSFFWPFYSDYRILMLDDDYSYALVGSDSDDFLWILSRTPSLKSETLDHIIREAHHRGYNTDNLIWVKQ